MIGHDKTTWNGELDKVGKSLLKDDYLGAFPADVIPENIGEGKCLICNTHTTKQDGEHWTAVMNHPEKGLIGFDSFGRKMNDLIPHLNGYGKIQDADLDVDQNDADTHCGQLCLSWLCLAKYNVDHAMMI